MMNGTYRQKGLFLLTFVLVVIFVVSNMTIMLSKVTLLSGYADRNQIQQRERYIDLQNSIGKAAHFLTQSTAWRSASVVLKNDHINVYISSLEAQQGSYVVELNAESETYTSPSIIARIAVTPLITQYPSQAVTQYNMEQWQTQISQFFHQQVSNWDTLTALSATRVDNCDGLDSLTVNLIVVTGHCEIGAGDVIGSDEQPVLVLVENGNFEVGASARLTGWFIVKNAEQILFDSNSQLNGAISFIESDNFDIANATVIHDLAVLTRLQFESQLNLLSRLKGHWHNG